MFPPKKPKTHTTCSRAPRPPVVQLVVRRTASRALALLPVRRQCTYLKKISCLDYETLRLAATRGRYTALLTSSRTQPRAKPLPGSSGPARARQDLRRVAASAWRRAAATASARRRRPCPCRRAARTRRRAGRAPCRLGLGLGLRLRLRLGFVVQVELLAG